MIMEKYSHSPNLASTELTNSQKSLLASRTRVHLPAPSERSGSCRSGDSPVRATIVDAVKSKLSNEYKLKKSGQKDFMTPLEEAHSDNTRTPRVLINHTKNTRLADRLDDEEWYLNVAKLLKGVKPENAHTTTEIIVSMATAFVEVGDLAVIEKKEEDRMVGRRSRCRQCGSITTEVFDSTTVSLWQRTQNTLDRTTKP